MRISDWSSDVCSSDLLHTKVTDDKFTSNPRDFGGGREDAVIIKDITNGANCAVASGTAGNALGANSFVNFVNNTINTAGIDVNGNGSVGPGQGDRSEEHTSELQSLMRISYAVFCLKKKKNYTTTLYTTHIKTNKTQ